MAAPHAAAAVAPAPLSESEDPKSPRLPVSLGGRSAFASSTCTNEQSVELDLDGMAALVGRGRTRAAVSEHCYATKTESVSYTHLTLPTIYSV